MRSLFGYLSVSVLSAIIGFVAIPLCTRLFDQQLLGQLNLLASIALIAYIVILLGLDQGYIRFYYEQNNEKARKSLLARSLCIPLLLWLLIVPILLGCRDSIGAYLNGDPVAIVLSLGCLVLSFVLFRFAICYCRVSNRLVLFGGLTIINVLFSKCIYLFNVGEKTLSTTLNVITAVSVIAITVCIVFLLKCNYYNGVLKGSAPLEKLLRYSLPLMPAMLLSTVNANIPLFFVRSALDFNAVGLFSMTVMVASAINVIGSGVNSFWPTYVFRSYKTQQHVIQLFHQVLTTCMVLFASVLIMLRFIIPMFLGNGYEGSGELFSLLLLSPICYTIGETAGIGIHIKKKSTFYLVIYALGLILNIVSCLALTQAFGVSGAAASVSISAITMLILKAVIGNRYYNSIGSMRWLLSAMLLVGLQALACQLAIEYAATVIISLACLAVFPLFVGVSAFKQGCQNVSRLLINTMKQRRG